MKNKNKNFNINMFMLLLLVILCMPLSVCAWYTYTIELLEWDNVDSGKHMDWSGSSIYINEFTTGVNTWNAYKSGVIRKDTLTTVNDLTISDVSYIAQDVAARTYSNGVMKYATNYMNNLGTSEKKNVSIHELGHSLGLAHRNESDSVMQEKVTSITTLSVGDQRNYDSAYNNY